MAANAVQTSNTLKYKENKWPIKAPTVATADLLVPVSIYSPNWIKHKHWLWEIEGLQLENILNTKICI